MPEQTPSIPEPAGGDGLMFIIAAAVVVVVIGEAAFVAFPSMLLLPFVILGALLITAGVIYAALHTIENDTPARPLKARPQTEPEPATPAVRARPVIGH